MTLAQMQHQDTIAQAIYYAIDTFSKGEGDTVTYKDEIIPVKFLRVEVDGIERRFYGIHVADHAVLKFNLFREFLLEQTGMVGKRIVELVGDSAKFSAQAGQFFKENLYRKFAKDRLIEYGFTGYLDPEKLDVNSVLNCYINENPEVAKRIVANVVGHSVIALEKWGCKVSSHVIHFVAVYNKFGMSEGYTKFGDDVFASDEILFAQEKDKMIVLEGGVQSFSQAVNVLRNNVHIHAVYGLRASEGNAGSLFSCAEFFCMIKKLQNPTLKNVSEEFNAYMSSRKGWDPKRNDASTKEDLFNKTITAFFNEGIYLKIPEYVKLIPGPNTCSLL